VVRVLEIAVESVAGARAAAAHGADRIELCVALADGGLTPSLGLVERAVAAVAVPVFAMVRPRAGGFCYDDDEGAVMARDVAAAKSAGARGIVLGALRPDGGLDEVLTRRLVEMARPLPVTFHRAFDHAADVRAALDQLIAWGIERVLTSGQAADAERGAGRIAELVRRAGDRLTVVAGGGVRAHNVRALCARTGVREVHSSARDGALADARRTVTDAEQVRALRAALRGDS
jgi:copper homeostasis protein